MEQNIPCPVCKSVDDKTVINEYHYSQAATYFCPATRDPDRHNRLAEAIKRLWKQEKGYFLRCTACGFGFGFPFVGGDDTFYNIVHEQAGYPKERWEYDMAINFFSKTTYPKRVLDIGAGAGFFLDKLSSPYKYALEGSATTRSILKGKGINVYDDENTMIIENEGTIDCVTMFQVLEHISDFKKIISTANKLLSLNGYFIISVPDCDAMINQERLTGYPDIFPNHINKWTPSSLELVLNKAGFKIEETVFEPPSIKKFFDSVYLKILYKATIPGTLASSIYKVKNKKIRIILLATYSIMIFPSLLTHYKKLDRKGSFLIKALKAENTTDAGTN